MNLNLFFNIFRGFQHQIEDLEIEKNDSKIAEAREIPKNQTL